MNQKTIIAVMAVVAIVIVAAAAVALTSNDDDEGGLKDGLGRSINVESTDKIAATSSIVTEIICGLGGYSKLAGVTVDSSYAVNEYVMGMPDDGYPKIINDGLSNGTLTNMGGMYMIATEAILPANPDVVIMGGYFNNEDTIIQLENMGIPVVVCRNDNSLEDIYFNIDLIGKVIGKESEAQTLINQMKSAIGKVIDWTASIDAAPQRVMVSMGFGYGNVYTNGDTYIMGTPMITALGGINAFSGEIPGMYTPISTEAIVTANPDIIIDNGSPSRADLDAITTDTLLKEINAAKNNKIYGAFETCNTSFGLCSQGFVNSYAFMAMFMYEDYLDFKIDHYMGNNYPDYLKLFWEQINS
ncbi:MAG: ABC transporter substrate-binding protein [Methanomassiliicoccaceae archaeon]|nr:ABC transporter substrate-binding protein [Methanomassiliicoccaceae archaeon]